MKVVLPLFDFCTMHLYDIFAFPCLCAVFALYVFVSICLCIVFYKHKVAVMAMIPRLGVEDDRPGLVPNVLHLYPSHLRRALHYIVHNMYIVY